MRPHFELLPAALIERILGEAFQLLAEPGVRVGSPEALQLLAAAGAAVVDEAARIPEPLARQALATVPRSFALYSRAGEIAVRYEGRHVHFDPGSSCVHYLDAETQQRRLAETRDLVELVEVTEALPQFAAQSTAVVCSDAPRQIADLYRLHVVLTRSAKPVVTGAFSAATLGGMLDLLTAEAGGVEALRRRPRAVFDVCPSPPLHWSSFAAQNMVDLARAGVPAEIVSMPMAGATAPVTLVGSVTQHAAECLAGITIHQLACAGAPVVWGGAPSTLDMHTGIAPVGAIETAMLNIACAEVGKHLGLPTHAYLAASDAKLHDAQAGAESGVSATLGALAGINMVSGAGMLDSLACHSAEKLVVDAEGLAAAQRLVAGFDTPTETLAVEMIRQAGFEGNFLAQRDTRALFRQQQYLPSTVTDREPSSEFAREPLLARARARVAELRRVYAPPRLAEDLRRALDDVVAREARRWGVEAPSHAAARLAARR